jgi:hypothetical protein
MVLAGILVLVTVPLIPVLIPSLAPATVQAGLQSLQTQGTLYSVVWVLYLVSDLFYLVVFFGLRRVLGKVSASVAALAVGLNALFVVLDVGLDIPLRLYLVVLSNAYYAPGADKAGTLATAQFAVQGSNLVALGATGCQFVAVTLVGYLMTRSGSFRRGVGYLGILTGVAALLFIPAFIAGSQLAGLFNLAGFVLLGVWSILAGLKLRSLLRLTSLG